MIIPTRNSANTISQCLESIITQTYGNIEVLVVDAFSSDNTVEIASKFKADVFSFKGERTKAKNFGISKSRGQFLLFIDSDMILQHDIVKECLWVFTSDPRNGGIVIPERSVGSKFWVKIRDFERSLYAGSEIESARFFLREDVIKVGGFDEDIVFYEESILPQNIKKLGKSVDARITSYLLHDEEGFELNKWLSKKHYYSLNAKTYHHKYAEYAKYQTSIIYRVHIITAKGKWKLLVRHPLLTLGVFILKILELVCLKRI